MKQRLKLFRNDNAVLNGFEFCMTDDALQKHIKENRLCYDVYYNNIFCKRYDLPKGITFLEAEDKLKELVLSAMMEYDIIASVAGNPTIISQVEEANKK